MSAENPTDIATRDPADLGDAKHFHQSIAPCTVDDVERWVSVSLLEEKPREHGVAPAFANGCIKGVCVAIEQVAPVARQQDERLGEAFDLVAKVFRHGINAGVRS